MSGSTVPEKKCNGIWQGILNMFTRFSKTMTYTPETVDTSIMYWKNNQFQLTKLITKYVNKIQYNNDTHYRYRVCTIMYYIWWQDSVKIIWQINKIEKHDSHLKKCADKI
jgi:hypothetical protein